MIINKSESVTQKSVSAVKWSTLMELVSRVGSPIVFLVLARLLTPEDFGVVSTAMIVVSFSQIFWDAGLGKALVQTTETLEYAANVVFWTNLGLGIVICTVLFLAAPWVAAFFNSPSLTPVFRVLGLQLVMASLASVQSALFVRDLAFRQLFWIKLATAFVPGLFSIPLAFFGYGVWALVAGSLAGSFLNLVLVWARSMWRPRMQFNWYLAQKLFGFGSWVVLESFGNWFYLWGDNFLVGKIIGVKELGIYSIAWSMNSIIFGLLLNPFFSVLYPTFSRLHDDIETLKKTVRKANMMTLLSGLPLGTALLLINRQIISVFFVKSWDSLGFVLGVIGFMHGISLLAVVSLELCRAMGRPDINSKLLLGVMFCYLPVYLVTAPFGLEMFILGRLGVEIIWLPIHVYLCKRMLGISPFYLWYEGKPIIFATSAMALVIVGCKEVFTLSANAFSDVLMLISLIIAGGVTYGGTLWLLDQPLVLEMKALFRRVAVI